MFKENTHSLKRIPAEVLAGMTQRKPKVKFLSSSWQVPQLHPDLILKVPPFSIPWARGLRRIWVVLQQSHGFPQWDCVREGEGKETEVWEARKCQWFQRQRRLQSRKVKAMLVLIGKMENQFLELELAKLSWDYSTNSIHLLSALLLTLMDQVGTYKANDMVPFIASLYNLFPLPWGGRGHQRPGQISGETGLASQHLLCVVSQLAPRWGEHFWQ